MGFGDLYPMFSMRWNAGGVGIVPQLDSIIPLGTMQAYINVKGYGEFDAQNWAHRWTTWLTVSFAPASPGPEPPPSTMRRTYTK
jgi:hypothetical protein